MLHLVTSGLIFSPLSFNDRLHVMPKDLAALFTVGNNTFLEPRFVCLLNLSNDIIAYCHHRSIISFRGKRNSKAMFSPLCIIIAKAYEQFIWPRNNSRSMLHKFWSRDSIGYLPAE